MDAVEDVAAAMVQGLFRVGPHERPRGVVEELNAHIVIHDEDRRWKSIQTIAGEIAGGHHDHAPVLFFGKLNFL
jgi:hypothetical protein